MILSSDGSWNACAERHDMSVALPVTERLDSHTTAPEPDRQQHATAAGGVMQPQHLHWRKHSLRMAQQKQTLLAALWCLLCVACTLRCWPSLEPDAVRLFLLYFQPLIPPTFMLWLWTHNVRAFEQRQIPYDECFSSRDRRMLLPSGDLARLSLTTTTIVATWACLFAWTAARRMYLVTEYIPMLLYCSITMMLALPLNTLGRTGRLFFLQTAQRVALPVQAVSWADFLLADMLTSLAKSSGDAAQALCTMATGPSLQHLSAPSFRSASSLCSPLSTGIMAAVCLPYAIRLVQCLIVWRTTSNTAQVFNALKYCSAFPALVLTALEHESHIYGRPFSRFNLWIAAVTFNTVFSYYWDVEMDWDMPWFAAAAMQPHHNFGRASSHAHHHHTPASSQRKALQALRRGLPYLRPRVLFPAPWYLWLCLSNLVLRLGWTHRLMGNLEASAAVSIVMALLEVFRRYQWAFARVETELRKLRLLPVPHSSQAGAAPASAAMMTVVTPDPHVQPQQQHELKDMPVANGSAHAHIGVHLIKHSASHAGGEGPSAMPVHGIESNL